MTISTPPQNARLRMSCDGCSEAKVKCDKKHPSCDRCVNYHRKCTYGISRRHGKQSWQKKLASDRAKVLGTGPRPPDLVPFESISLPGGLNGTPSPLAGQTWTQPTYPVIALDSSAQSSFDQSQDLFRFDDFLEPMQFWPHVELPSSFIFHNLESSSLQPDINAQAPISPDIHTHQQSNHEPQAFASFSSDTVTGSPRHLSRSRYQQAYTNRIHDCEARAIAVLRSLHHHYSRPPHSNQVNLPQGLMSSIGGNVPEKPPLATPITVPTFDQVLFANRLALSGWSELMECTCTRCPHLGFLYVSIISKVLFWYRVVAARMCPLPDCELDDNHTNAPSQQRNTLDVPPEFKIRLTAIQIGILELDQEDQANLRRVMLLRELRRVDKAVAEMANMKHVTDNDPATYHAAQWLQLGVSRVRDQLREVIQHVEQDSQE